MTLTVKKKSLREREASVISKLRASLHNVKVPDKAACADGSAASGGH